MNNKIKINYFRLIMYFIFMAIVCFLNFFNPRSALIIILITMIVLFLPSFLLIFKKVKLPKVNLYMANSSQLRYDSNEFVTELSSNSIFPFTKILMKYELNHEFEPENKHYFEVNYSIFNTNKTFKYHITFDYCGIYCIKASEIRFYDFLGIVYAYTQSNTAHAVVMPLKLSHDFTDEKIALNQDEEDKNDPTKGFDVSEIRELREYREGDTMSQIHWKLSTKSEDLIVKEYERLAGTCIVIGLDNNANSLKELNYYYDILYTFGSFVLESEIYFDLVYYNAKEGALIRTNITNSYDFSQAIENMLFNIHKTDINELLEYYRENFGKSKLFIISSTEADDNDFRMIDRIKDVYLYIER